MRRLVEVAGCLSANHTVRKLGLLTRFAIVFFKSSRCKFGSTFSHVGSGYSADRRSKSCPRAILIPLASADR